LVAVAITGATGFIGSALCRELSARGHDVRAIGRNGERLASLNLGHVQKYVCDLAKEIPPIAALMGCECVIHLADQANRTTKTLGYSSEITSNILQGIVTAGVPRVIQASSIYATLAEYGACQSYGTDKLIAEKMLSSIPGVANVVLRLPPVYGAGSRGGINTLAALIARGIPLPFGLAKAPRDYINIDNLLDLLTIILSTPADDLGNLLKNPIEPSDGQSVSTRELAVLIGQVLEKPARIFPFPKSMLIFAAKLAGKSEIAEAALGPLIANTDFQLLKNAGWQPRLKMPEGLAYLRR